MAEESTGDSLADSWFHQVSSSNIKPDTSTDPHGNGAIASGSSLIHHFGGQYPVQGENILMVDDLLVGTVFDETQAGKIIGDFTLRSTGDGGNFPAFLHGPHLFQGEGIALDGRGRMSVARPGVFLQSRNPRYLNRGRLAALAQRGNLLDPGQQGRSDGELRPLTHASNYNRKSSVSQVIGHVRKGGDRAARRDRYSPH